MECSTGEEGLAARFALLRVFVDFCHVTEWTSEFGILGV